MSQAPTRIEHDLLGDRAVPAEAYYGIHTLRALENFRITETAISIYPDLVRALACVKQAAALANNALGLLPDDKADAIARACEEIREGKLLDPFVVDVIQGGAGTSTNMNANEVIANRALELLGRKRGEYRYLHPVEDVNMSQSTNDVYPTAVKVALHFAIDRLGAAMRELRLAFDAKAREFADVLKMGRTQLQDAVPMTLGQEFTTYVVMLDEDEERLREAALLITEINLGATAIGTGINAHPDYAALVCQRLAEVTGIRLVTASNLVEATQDAGAFVQLSGVLKRIAVKLSKVCNDLRLLSSGPRAGLGFAAEAGQLQLNAFEPIIAHSLFKSLMHLRNGCDTLRERCVTGITANRERMAQAVRESIGLVTALNPYIGYSAASEVAREALATGRTVYDLVLEKKLLSKEQLDEILRPEVLTRPGRWMPPPPPGAKKGKL